MANDRIFPRASALLLTFAIGLVFVDQANAAGGTLQGTSCQFSAFVEETDPAGLNVRAAPDLGSPVLGTLPPVWSDGSGWQVRIQVTVTASFNGWFRIIDAKDDETLTGQPPRPVYAGEGWVSGRKLVVKSQADAGHTRPTPNSPTAVRMKNGMQFDSDSTVDAGRPVACQGEWVQVEYEEARFSADMRPHLQIMPTARAGLPKGRFRAWLDKICGIQETACDGP